MRPQPAGALCGSPQSFHICLASPLLISMSLSCVLSPPALNLGVHATLLLSFIGSSIHPSLLSSSASISDAYLFSPSYLLSASAITDYLTKEPLEAILCCSFLACCVDLTVSLVSVDPLLDSMTLWRVAKKAAVNFCLSSSEPADCRP